MPLAKTGTCDSCGYAKIQCICHNQSPYGTTNKRNSSGHTQRYQHFTNYDNTDDYARTSEMQRQTTEFKFNHDIYPVTDENLVTFFARSELSSTESVKYAQNKHIYGGRKPWPSHTNSATCPVCTLSQQVETWRQIFLELSQLHDLSQYKIIVNRGVTPLLSTISIVTTDTPDPNPQFTA